MNIRSLKNQLKEPIYKDDLKRVLLNGLLFTVLFSLLAGALQFFTETYLHLSMAIFIFLIAFMVGKKISESYFTFHIIYPCFAVLCFLIGYALYNFTKIFFIFRDFKIAADLFFSSVGLNYMFGFFNIATYTGINALYNIIDILIFVGSIITVWQIVWRHR